MFNDTKHIKSNFAGAFIVHSCFDGAIFNECIMDDGVFYLSRFDYANMYSCSLVNSNFYRADISHVDFGKSRLHGTILLHSAARCALYEFADFVDTQIFCTKPAFRTSETDSHRGNFDCFEDLRSYIRDGDKDVLNHRNMNSNINNESVLTCIGKLYDPPADYSFLYDNEEKLVKGLLSHNNHNPEYELRYPILCSKIKEVHPKDYFYCDYAKYWGAITKLCAKLYGNYYHAVQQHPDFAIEGNAFDKIEYYLRSAA